MYWRPSSVARELKIGELFNHVPSDQFAQISASPGDTLWLLTADHSNRLFLAGRLIIDCIVDGRTVRKTAKGRALWPASYHAFSAPGEAEPYRKVDISGIVRSLRFISGKDRLDTTRHFGNQLQRMRALSQESADRLAVVWNGKGRPRRSEAPVPNPASLSRLSLEELRKRALHGGAASRDPQQQITNRRYRSECIKQYVLKRAAGKCEGCRARAPFRTPSGIPYLEPHHIRRLADEGPDHPRWVIALCPNCHRRTEFSADAERYNEKLASIAAKLERDQPA